MASSSTFSVLSCFWIRKDSAQADNKIIVLSSPVKVDYDSPSSCGCNETFRYCSTRREADEVEVPVLELLYPKSVDADVLELLYPESVENIEPPYLGSLAIPWGLLLISECTTDI